MPVMASITINDGKVSPAAHVFDPVSTNGRKATWMNRSIDVLGASEVLSFEVVAPVRKGSAYRVIGSLTRPITATVDGQLVVVRQNKTNFDLNFSADGSLAERKDDAALIANFFANATVKTAIQNVEPFY